MVTRIEKEILTSRAWVCKGNLLIATFQSWINGCVGEPSARKAGAAGMTFIIALGIGNSKASDRWRWLSEFAAYINVKYDGIALLKQLNKNKNTSEANIV